MACSDKSGGITMTRGTTYTVALKIKKAGDTYQLAEGEILRFGVKKNIDDHGYLIRKDISASDFNTIDGCYYITILPKETEGLGLGTYRFDIGIQPDDINYYNVLAPSPFVLTANITRREDSYENS